MYSVKQLIHMHQYIGWQRIMDGQGFEIAFTGMFIVFLALAAISLCIAVLPKIMVVLAHSLYKIPQRSSDRKSEHDDAAVAAAVGIVLDERENTH